MRTSSLGATIRGMTTPCGRGRSDNLRYVGLHADRWPQRDNDNASGYIVGVAFGSAHVSGIQAAFCDGSVKTISYTVDPKVWVAIGTRAGGEVTPDNGAF